MSVRKRAGLTALFTALTLTATASLATAQTKVVIAVAPAPEMVAAFIAKEQGLFKKNGLDAEVRVIQGGAAIPVALASGGIQIGVFGTPNLLQANDSGLDFVVVAGGAVASKTDENYGIVAKAGSGIETPKDLAGKKIALPGLEGFFHVLAREWLTKSGVDTSTVTFIEGNFPALGDILKAGTVDAIVTTQPFLGRAVSSGAGAKVFHIAHELPDGLPPFVYVATRKWAEANPAVVKAFRQSIAEAITIAETHVEASRADYGKYVKLPPDALATVQWNKMSADVRPDQIQLWIEMMQRQKMLKTQIDAASLFPK
ncbi:ABC transporter substrate-binding protein [Bradyrhizobium sp. U87765 SZCCT0131]|uniref:ABC transporter substrate-binding protein n=1 Tax=unclassified Bradyrhizobium TaxID=2631580 RepID=UPI001BAE525B|nr:MULTISPECIES: ABC transporter substrate-binding protein [unclassified Bradyrhizobium]MBR1221403.1 ABC transporter substrate-binding protein [Bradyrhizobium sp. U87765 SZCCT0131]MBR1264674.1 ABC transporter substrate-binding protein [Bradyrhizobium sp. U87765 SZCCT0134]MBR1304420.1 ABC transporter substrate-binding protein [Bradyrhizobium sp. U87765 SZCCT0110]MBR1322723.1 ABC transporter substrate-binding protein [Bradyrhizobium sp. U87765 SZCCT0109]MBR1346349.1 ABC transporter substrate-bin